VYDARKIDKQSSTSARDKSSTVFDKVDFVQQQVALRSERFSFQKDFTQSTLLFMALGVSFV